MLTLNLMFLYALFSNTGVGSVRVCHNHAHNRMHFLCSPYVIAAGGVAFSSTSLETVASTLGL